MYLAFSEKVPVSVIFSGRLAGFVFMERKYPNALRLMFPFYPYSSSSLDLIVNEDGCVKYMESCGLDKGARILAALEKALNTKIEVLDLGTFQDDDEVTKARRVDFWNHQLSCLKDADKKAFWMQRKEAGFKIDPDTAKLYCIMGDDFDPYWLFSDEPEWPSSAARVSFARAPGSDIWVEFGDLPETTRDAIRDKIRPKAG
jgi:hypothetical protein